ncbi:LuxR C-terminal-related transcriptional regulator [Burkholderia sp. MR1-5-21]
MLIIDEHPIVANAIEGALADIDDSLAVTICHSAGSAIDTFRRAPAWYRILLDLDVPGAHGIALARQFHAWGVADRCAIVTATDDPSWIAEAKRLGMIAYLVKSMPLDAFSTGLQSILDGKRVFPEVASSDDPGVRLTRRQRDVLSLLCRGYSTKEIAVKRGLAVGTVDNHIANAMQALQVRNRTHAITRAIALGMIDGCEGGDGGFAPGERSTG